jgi:hypothetical protein
MSLHISFIFPNFELLGFFSLGNGDSNQENIRYIAAF